MSLIFRLLWLFLTQVLGRGRPEDPFAPVRVRSVALPNDLDLNLHVNNGRLMTFIDFGRLAWLYRIGALQICYRHRRIPVVGDVSARYLKPLRAFERFTIETRILGWSARWAYFEHRLIRADGQVAVIVADRGLFWRRGHGAMSAAQVIAELPYENQPSPELPHWVALWARSLELSREAVQAGTIAQPDETPTIEAPPPGREDGYRHLTLAARRGS
jgi:acyl-CoA thioesterase FadM